MLSAAADSHLQQPSCQVTSESVQEENCSAFLDVDDDELLCSALVGEPMQVASLLQEKRQPRPPLTVDDLFREVVDWQSNIQLAYDPLNLWGTREDVDAESEFDATWKRLFRVPYVEQTLPNLEANPLWLSLKEHFISASECGTALNENSYEHYDDYLLHKSGILKKVPDEDMIEATHHGKVHEPRAGMLYCVEKRDVAFKFGIIPHLCHRYLAISPDMLLKSCNTIVELKCPLRRQIVPLSFYDSDVKHCLLDGGKYNLDLETVVLLRETAAVCNGSFAGADEAKRRYLSITNLPISTVHLLDKYKMYWHQVQMQWEVLRVGQSVDFVQYGTAPNRHHNEFDLLSCTTVPCADVGWISVYGDKLRKTWDEINYWKSSASEPDKRNFVEKCLKRRKEEEIKKQKNKAWWTRKNINQTNTRGYQPQPTSTAANYSSPQRDDLSCPFSPSGSASQPTEKSSATAARRSRLECPFDSSALSSLLLPAASKDDDNHQQRKKTTKRSTEQKKSLNP